MSVSRSIRDTFLHFLADNLTMPVHNIRRDPTDPSADEIRANAVNVTFLVYNPTNAIGTQTVIVDVINDDELVATEWLQNVYDILSAAFMTPRLDYTDPTNPVSTSTNLYWSRDSVRFTPVSSDFYTRYSLMMPIHFH